MLDRASDRSQILREVLALREEFAPFRRRYANYQVLLQNDNDLTLGQLVDARRESVEEIRAALKLLSAERTDSRILAENPGSEGIALGFG